MEESYETFEEELGSPRADPPPQKPVRQIRRPGGSTHTHTHAESVMHAQNCLHLLYMCILLYKSINTKEQGATEI